MGFLMELSQEATLRGDPQEQRDQSDGVDWVTRIL